LTNQFIRNLGPENDKVQNNLIWCDVPAVKIVELLAEFIVHPESRKAKPEFLSNYIQNQLTKGELTNWTVVLKNNTTAAEAQKIDLGGFIVGLTKRTDPTDPIDPERYIMRQGRFISPKDEYIDLSKDQIAQAFDLMRNDPDRIARSSKTPDVPSGPYIRTVRSPQSGLLLIYPLIPDETHRSDEAFIGLAFSIPKSDNVIPIQYKVNNIYWEQEFGS
jgi:hypothetical protein